MPSISRIGIISKPGAAAAYSLVPRLLAWCAERDIEFRYDQETAAYVGRSDGLPRLEVADACQMLVVLGGDGTLLSAARAIAGKDG
jgi:NAD+ kinase